jgi:hypothetical protein
MSQGRFQQHAVRERQVVAVEGLQADHGAGLVTDSKEFKNVTQPRMRDFFHGLNLAIKAAENYKC